MLKYLAALMLVISCSMAAYAGDLPAADPVLNDFAYGLQMSVESVGAVGYLNLPEDIYQKAFREDLGDIRVFNAEGEAVPHGIKRPDMAAQRKPGVQIPFFPLYGPTEKETDAKSKGVSLYINTDDSGTIVDMRSDALGQKGKKIEAYLFDLSHIDEPPGELEFQWSPPKENFNVPILLEGSHDLRAWQMVADRESIAELNFSGHTLIKNKISVPFATSRYLRLTWPPQTQDVILTDVKAIFSEKPTDYPRLWIAANGKKAQEGIGAYEFDSGGVFPVDRINIELPEPNTLIQVMIQSRRNREGDWVDRHQGLFYRLNVDDAEISNDTVAIGTITDRYWRMEVVSEGSALGAGIPKLKLGWIQYRLLFLMRGSPPFTLAYGSATVTPSHYTVEKLFPQIREINKIDMIQTAITGNPFLLGGPDRLNPLPAPLPWKKWALWGVLLLSVAILGVMAIRLFRQMGA